MKNRTFTTKNVPPVERRSRETIMYGFGGLGRALVIVWKNKIRKQNKTNTGGEFARWANTPRYLQIKGTGLWLLGRSEIYRSKLRTEGAKDEATKDPGTWGPPSTYKTNPGGIASAFSRRGGAIKTKQRYHTNKRAQHRVPMPPTSPRPRHLATIPVLPENTLRSGCEKPGAEPEGKISPLGYPKRVRYRP